MAILPLHIDDADRDDARPLLQTLDHASDCPTTPRGSLHHKPPHKVPFLDGLRGLAATVVVIHHAGFLLADIGQGAVDVFFLLSAFLLTMGFEQKARELIVQNAGIKRWSYILLDYAQRRFFRVYPLFALTAVTLSLLSPDQQKTLFYVHKPENFDLIKVLTFDMNHRYHVFWTLPLEIQYYLIIPPLVVAVLKLGKLSWVPMVPMGVFIVYAGCTWFRTYGQPLGPHLPTFLTGSLAAFVYTRMDDWIRTNHLEFKWHHTLTLRCIEMLNLIVLFSVEFRGLFFHWVVANPVPQSTGDPFIHANAGIVVVCEMLLPGAVARVLEWELLRSMGKISFSVYLWHSFIVNNPTIYRQPEYDWFFSTWLLVFLVGTISYHLVEVPCFKLASHIGRLIQTRDAAQANKEIHTRVATENNAPHYA